MDRSGVRGSRRADRRVTACASELCADGLRRRYTDGIAFVWNNFHSVECKNQRQEGTAFLDADGARERDVAVHTGFVDVYRSVRAPGGAESVRRGRSAVSAYRTDDGRAGGTAKSATERSLAAADFDRLLFAAHLVAVSIFIYRHSLAVRFTE